MRDSQHNLAGNTRSIDEATLVLKLLRVKRQTNYRNQSASRLLGGQLRMVEAAICVATVSALRELTQETRTNGSMKISCDPAITKVNFFSFRGS